eukprot:3112797-Karenia_brevis.AAC.1
MRQRRASHPHGKQSKGRKRQQARSLSTHIRKSQQGKWHKSYMNSVRQMKSSAKVFKTMKRTPVTK